jgi:hypothetical protein
VGEVHPCLEEHPWREGSRGVELRYGGRVQGGGDDGRGYGTHCSRRRRGSGL